MNDNNSGHLKQYEFANQIAARRGPEMIAAASIVVFFAGMIWAGNSFSNPWAAAYGIVASGFCGLGQIIILSKPRAQIAVIAVVVMFSALSLASLLKGS